MSFEPFKLKKVYYKTIFFNLCGFISFFILFPNLRYLLTKEDYLLENLSASLFLGAFLLGSIILSRIRETRFIKSYFWIPLVALLGFLDEISFGERFFNFQPPELLGKKMDAVHDLLGLSCSWYKASFLGDQGSTPFWIIPLATLAIALFFGYNALRKQRLSSPENISRFTFFLALTIGTITAHAFSDRVVSALYNQHSFECLNKLMAGRAINPVESYQETAKVWFASFFSVVFLAYLIYEAALIFKKMVLHDTNIWQEYPAFIYILFASGFMILAVIIDAATAEFHFYKRWFVFIEELSEYIVALSFCFSCVAMAHKTDL